METDENRKVLMLASVASMIDQFNMRNIELLLGMGYKVHVACNFKEGNTCSRQRLRRLSKKLQQMHVMRHQWDCPRNAKEVRKCCKAYRQLMGLTDRYHFSWIHCHSPVGGALARLAAHRQRIRIIYTAHGFHFYHGAPFKNWLLYYPVEKLLAHWTDVLLTVNKEDYYFAKQKLRATKIGYLPGIGIDVCHFLNAPDKNKEFRTRYQIPEHAAILLSVGELSRRKNHQMVISVLSKLHEKEIHYLICGQGNLKKALLRQAKKAGVSDRVHILGFQEDVAEFYRNADLFVFPSKQEGLPVALMEAMASGLPCIVSDIRGNRELIDSCISENYFRKQWKANEEKEYGGICFSLDQPEKLKKAIELMLENPQLRCDCGRYNQTKVLKYDLHIVENRMEKIYCWIGRYKT